MRRWRVLSGLQIRAVGRKGVYAASGTRSLMRRWRVLSAYKPSRRPDKAFTPHPASQYRSYMRRFRSHRPGLTAPDRLCVFSAVTGVLIIQRFDPEF